MNVFYVLFMIFVLTFYLGLYFYFNMFWFVIEVNFVPLIILDFKLYLYIDWISLIFISVVSLISSLTFYFSKFYMSNEMIKKQNLFIVLTLMFVLSMFLMISSLNLFFIMLGWDGLGLISYCLVIFYQNEISNYSGLITILTNRLGDISLILSMSFLITFYSLDIFVMNFKEDKFNMFLFLLVLGAFTKSAQYPFSSWLPLAMAAPTPISALVHSSTLVTAGVYLIMRFNLILNMNFMISQNFFYLVLLTMFLSGSCALFETDFKKIIALSTLSQLSVMMMIMFCGYELMSFYHLLTHALFKALLFLCSGCFIHMMQDTQDIRSYGLLSISNPLVSGIFFMSSLSLMGFPYLSGFYSKDLILEMVYSLNINLFSILVILVSTFFTSMYSLRLIYMGLMKNYSVLKLELEISWDKMNNPLVFMMFLVIFTGSLLSWVFSDIVDSVYINLKMKLLNMFLIALAIMFFSYTYLYKMVFVAKFFSKMWYMTDSLGFIMNLILKNSSFYLNKIDNGWTELQLTEIFVMNSKDLNNVLWMPKFSLFVIFMLIFMISLIML